MHCHLRPPVPPVILGVNQEANAMDQQCTFTPNFSEIEHSVGQLLQYKHVKFWHRLLPWIWSEVDFHNAAASEHQHIKFQHNKGMWSRVIDDSKFSWPIFRVPPTSPVSQTRYRTTPDFGRINVNQQHSQECTRFPIHSLVLKPESFKGIWD